MALSFYNLVPSCPTCNHIKRENELDIHPYEKGFGDEFKFNLKTQNDEAVVKGNYKILLCDNKEETNSNIDSLGLNPLYEGHIDYVDEIIDKAQAYNLDYYKHFPSHKENNYYHYAIYYLMLIGLQINQLNLEILHQ